MITHMLSLTFATLITQYAFPLPIGTSSSLREASRPSPLYYVYRRGKVIPGIPLLLQDMRELGLPFSMLHNAMEKSCDQPQPIGLLPPSTVNFEIEREREIRAEKVVRFSTYSFLL